MLCGCGLSSVNSAAYNRPPQWEGEQPEEEPVGDKQLVEQQAESRLKRDQNHPGCFSLKHKQGSMDTLDQSK